MKCFCSAFALLLFFMMMLPRTASGQEVQIPVLPPLEHELKVYPDPASGELYWPLDKPVYVRLATSAEEGAESHLMEKMYLSRSGQLSPEQDISIDLDISGNQYIRWFNAASRDTLMLRFQADGQAPESELLFSGAERHEAGGLVYYGAGLQLDIESSDAHAGVAERFLSVNREDYRSISAAAGLQEEMLAEVWYYAIDQVGNVEAPQREEFMIDLTPPESHHEITGTFREGVLAPSAELLLFSEDRYAGVREIHYRLHNEEPFQRYEGGPISLSELEDGAYTLSYYAVDYVGNQESAQTFDFYLDRLAPQPEISVDGDQYQAEDGRLFVSGRTEFRLSAEDNRAGTQYITYAIDGQAQGRYFDPFRLPGISGTRRVSFSATDRVENSSPSRAASYEMDAQPPQSSYRFEGAFHRQRNIYWMRSDARIFLSASDEGAGVAETFYDLQGNMPETPYQQPIAIDEEGRYNLSFYSTDQVNNQEGLHFVMVVVDNSPPEIMVNFNTSPTGVRTAAGGEQEVYRLGTRIFLAATDAASGAERILYRLNEAEEQEYDSPINLFEPGEYELQLRALDHVGNQTRQELRFIIE